MKNQIKQIYYLLILLSTVGLLAAEKPDTLFLLGGQSNMLGAGYTEDLPKSDDYQKFIKPIKNVFVWNGKEKQWQALTVGEKFGPELGFTYKLSMALPDKTIGIIKHAVGGTSMDKWKPGGKLYTSWMSKFTEAQKTVPEAKLAAILWHQGESDSDSVEVARAYKQKMTSFINTVRADLKSPDQLFILGQINPGTRFFGKDRFLQAPIVREAQANLNLKNVYMIKTDDFEKNKIFIRKRGDVPGNEDNIHYSAKGQIGMGMRFAEEFLKRKPQ